MDDTADRTASNILNLHRRHAAQINLVLDNAIGDHAFEIREGKLPDSCLIILCLPDKYKSLLQPALQEDKPTFKKDGEKWVLSYDGKTIFMDAREGMAYIAYLLRYPRKEFHVIELYSVVNKTSPPAEAMPYSKMSNKELQDEGMRIAGRQTFEQADEKALQEVRKRVAEISGEIEQAKRNKDFPKEANLRNELKQLEAYLGSSTGLDGKPRKVPDISETIRKTVSNAIERSRQVILDQHKTLGQHLKNSIPTGTYVAYNPDQRIDWQL